MSEQEAPADDIGSDVASAFDQIEGTSPPPPTPDGTLPAAPTTAPVAETPAQAQQRARDAQGRFAPKDATPPPLPTDAHPKPGAAPQPPTQPPVSDPRDRAPHTWKLEAREAWGNLPQQVKQEIMRREYETAQALKDSSGARQALNQLQQTIQPYQQLLQTRYNGDVLGMINGFMQAEAVAMSGSKADKARLFAKWIKDYDVDIEALDGELAGIATPENDHVSALRKEIQSQLQPVMQMFGNFQQQRQNQSRQIVQEAYGEVSTFGENVKEFPYFQELRLQMADLIEMADRRGQTLSLKDAYEQAGYLHPEIRARMIHQQQASGAQARHTAAQRARTAAVSVTGAPAGQPPGDTPPDTLRGSIEAAIDSLNR